MVICIYPEKIIFSENESEIRPILPITGVNLTEGLVLFATKPRHPDALNFEHRNVWAYDGEGKLLWQIPLPFPHMGDYGYWLSAQLLPNGILTVSSIADGGGGGCDGFDPYTGLLLKKFNTDSKYGWPMESLDHPDEKNARKPNWLVYFQFYQNFFGAKNIEFQFEIDEKVLEAVFIDGAMYFLLDNAKQYYVGKVLKREPSYLKIIAATVDGQRLWESTPPPAKNGGEVFYNHVFANKDKKLWAETTDGGVYQLDRQTGKIKG